MIKAEPRMHPTDTFVTLSPSSHLTGRGTDRFTLETVSSEEVLVIDDRSELSPAQAVEDRLSRMLREATMPISHLQMRGILRTR